MFFPCTSSRSRRPSDARCEAPRRRRRHRRPGRRALDAAPLPARARAHPLHDAVLRRVVPRSSRPEQDPPRAPAHREGSEAPKPDDPLVQRRGAEGCRPASSNPRRAPLGPRLRRLPPPRPAHAVRTRGRASHHDRRRPRGRRHDRLLPPLRESLTTALRRRPVPRPRRR